MHRLRIGPKKKAVCGESPTLIVCHVESGLSGTSARDGRIHSQRFLDDRKRVRKLVEQERGLDDSRTGFSEI